MLSHIDFNMLRVDERILTFAFNARYKLLIYPSTR